MTDADVRYFWAAYQMGMWEDELPRDLNRDQFYMTLVDIIGEYDMEFVFEVKGPNGKRPAGVLLADFRMKGNAIEPHVWWFPWASARNQLESSAHFLRDMGKRYKVLVYTETKDSVFWERIYRYKGLLKKGCKITDAFGSGEDSMLYYTPGPF